MINLLLKIYENQLQNDELVDNIKDNYIYF